MDSEAFLPGYGALKLYRGRYLPFAAYLGAVMDGWLGALVAKV
ncbi:hypothetical protein J2S00_003645 [Caldalkalibacillus uzonensis]|uniref:Uncharacterized protein n=1 Tax=Caldalkalibacillus uzonensis TaxID=353224 RepID=A0ABU0CWP0_9BACI|nr:hypothetical protein [Caldalkalibacillus uzonensis]MDQ0340805.1 hypothetical protein [Caldalkalibacillus uzonensis]